MISINKKEDCMGCYACASICPVSCITMESDEEGFWYPDAAPDECRRCGLCIKVCPIVQKQNVKGGRGSGLEPRAYAACNTDTSVRISSSSGGIFSLLAEVVIDSGGVVFGAAFDEQFNVYHDYVDAKEDLSRFQGSKYVQSRIGESYQQAREFLKQGRLVLFSGTPCQISGLQHYLGKAYGNLVCQDIVCHGVPSPEVWQKYVAYRESRASSPARRIAFRRKNSGWKRFSVSFSFEDDTEYLAPLDRDLYMRAFLRNVCLRPSCHACHFKGINRESDITLADFWGVQKLLPEMDDDRGVSLVLVHSPKGQDLFERVRQRMVIREVDVEDAIRHNSVAVRSVTKHPRREEFFECLGSEPIDQLIERVCHDSLPARIRSKMKSGLRVVLRKLGLLDAIRVVLERGKV